eukprot:TRINITY_DN5116_c0_g1_i2.p1 TRINITY_DN5116_c0_g1~~TRINITY_DN5116_c0_g1_i2.p1  ORF type:complete len:568 (+),score=113.53 TRINITY_DN5116_c0_g1_i2:36-1706(+)
MSGPFPQFSCGAGHLYSTRSPVYGTRGIVATSQPLASEAGMRILQQGGNAADAAVAAAAALNVTQPCSTGIGGDCFALYYDAKTKKVQGINGSGRCPSLLTIEHLRSLGITGALPNFSAHTVTVPGAAAGWCDTVETFGSKRLTLTQVLAPAIELASCGFPVGPITAEWWQRGEEKLRGALNGKDMLTNEGRAPRTGEIFTNKNLANTFEILAREGKSGFYGASSPIAQAIVAAVQAEGGVMSLEDLGSHASTLDTPIHVSYKGYDVYEMPPSGQGLTALIALNILNTIDISEFPYGSPQHLHYLVEALRLAFADTRALLCDPSHGKGMPGLDHLMAAHYGETRRALIRTDEANKEIKCGYPFASSDTVYLSVVDGEGNACSFINSNYMGFGTGIVPHGCGFTLQNRGANFSLDPDHPNALAPGKRPYHTIIPGMVLKDGDLFCSFGNMGGFMQPQGHVQLLVNMLDYGMDPQTALNMPRFCITDGTHGGEVEFEDGTPPQTLEHLSRMGHRVNMKLVCGTDRALFGNGQIIIRNPLTGVLCAGSDNRADGLASAW